MDVHDEFDDGIGSLIEELRDRPLSSDAMEEIYQPPQREPMFGELAGNASPRQQQEQVLQAHHPDNTVIGQPGLIGPSAPVHAGPSGVGRGALQPDQLAIQLGSAGSALGSGGAQHGTLQNTTPIGAPLEAVMGAPAGLGALQLQGVPLQLVCGPVHVPLLAAAAPPLTGGAPGGSVGRPGGRSVGIHGGFGGYGGYGGLLPGSLQNPQLLATLPQLQGAIAATSVGAAVAAVPASYMVAEAGATPGHGMAAYGGRYGGAVPPQGVSGGGDGSGAAAGGVAASGLTAAGVAGAFAGGGGAAAGGGASGSGAGGGGGSASLHEARLAEIQRCLESPRQTEKRSAHKAIARVLQECAKQPEWAAGLPRHWPLKRCGFFVSAGIPEDSRRNPCGGTGGPKPLRVGKEVYLVFFYMDRCWQCEATYAKGCREQQHEYGRVCMMQLAYAKQPTAEATRKRFKQPDDIAAGDAVGAAFGAAAGAAAGGAAATGGTGDTDAAEGGDGEEGGSDADGFQLWVLKEPPAVAWYAYDVKPRGASARWRQGLRAAGESPRAPAAPSGESAPPQPLQLAMAGSGSGVSAAAAATTAALVTAAAGGGSQHGRQGGHTGRRSKRLCLVPVPKAQDRLAMEQAAPAATAAVAAAAAAAAPASGRGVALAWRAMSEDELRAQLWDQQGAVAPEEAIPGTVAPPWQRDLTHIVHHLLGCRSAATFRQLLADVSLEDLRQMHIPRDGQYLAHILVTPPSRLLHGDEIPEPPRDADEGLPQSLAMEYIQALFDRLAAEHAPDGGVLGPDFAAREWVRMLARQDLQHGATAVHRAGRYGHRLELLQRWVLPYASRQALLRTTGHVYLCYHSPYRSTHDAAGDALFHFVLDVAHDLAAWDAGRPRLAEILYGDAAAAVQLVDVVGQLVYTLRNKYFTGRNKEGYRAPAGRTGHDLLTAASARALERELQAGAAGPAPSVTAAAALTNTGAAEAVAVWPPAVTPADGAAGSREGLPAAAAAAAPAAQVRVAGPRRPFPSPPPQLGPKAVVLSRLESLACELDRVQPRRRYAASGLPDPGPSGQGQGQGRAAGMADASSGGEHMSAEASAA